MTSYITVKDTHIKTKQLYTNYHQYFLLVQLHWLLVLKVRVHSFQRDWSLMATGALNSQSQSWAVAMMMLTTTKKNRQPSFSSTEEIFRHSLCCVGSAAMKRRHLVKWTPHLCRPGEETRCRWAGWEGWGCWVSSSGPCFPM